MHLNSFFCVAFDSLAKIAQIFQSLCKVVKLITKNSFPF